MFQTQQKRLLSVFFFFFFFWEASVFYFFRSYLTFRFENTHLVPYCWNQNGRREFLFLFIVLGIRVLYAYCMLFLLTRQLIITNCTWFLFLPKKKKKKNCTWFLINIYWIFGIHIRLKIKYICFVSNNLT